MSVYLIANIDITDRQGYATYEAGFMEIFERFDGQILAVDENPTVIEGSHDHTRTVLLSFPDAQAADAWYHSPEYQALAQHRFKASRADLIRIQALP